MMNVAKLFFFFVLVLLLLTALISAASAQRCEPPSNGCIYGMFNYNKCLCECIKPFCPDANGDCILPTDNCGGNPWAGCTRGLDCPWWGSLSNDSVCNTGSTVPAGVWSIYNTREICCGVHAPFSSTCETIGPNEPVSSSNDDPEFDPAIDRPRSSFEAGSASRSSTRNTAILSYTAGFPAWAVVLTVIPSLVLFCFIGYCIFVGYYDQEEKEFVFGHLFNNHPSFDEPTNCSSDGSFCSSSTGRTSSSTGRTSCALYPVNIYTTNKKTAQDPQKMTAMVLSEPNYENPDPEGETTSAIAQALKNGENKSKIRSVSVGPDTKPKIELEPEEAAIIKEAPGLKAGPSVSSFVKAQRVLYGKLVEVDEGTSDDDKNDNDSYGSRFNLPHHIIYAPTPTRKNNMSEKMKGSFVSIATKGPNEEENTLAQKSGEKEKLTKRDSSSSSSSNWRKGKKQFRRLSSMTLTSLQERERSKEHRNYSGVESRSGSVGSIELESNASSVERYAEHLQKQSKGLLGSFVSFPNVNEGPNEEEKTRVQKSDKEEEKKKRDSSSRNSRKGHKESRRRSSMTLTSFQERERSKEHRNYSGVESCSGSVGSIEPESNASSVEERYAEHLQRQAEELKGSLVSAAMTAAAVAAVTRGKDTKRVGVGALAGSDESIAIELESKAPSVEERYAEHLQRQAEELKGSLVSAAMTAAAVAAVTRGKEAKRVVVGSLAGSDESIGISELESKAPSVGR